MTSTPQENPDQDPAPLQHADAERVSSDEARQVPDSQSEAAEVEDDPSANPDEQVLRDIKGG